VLSAAVINECVATAESESELDELGVNEAIELFYFGDAAPGWTRLPMRWYFQTSV
jgi:hypothetical protein